MGGEVYTEEKSLTPMATQAKLKVEKMTDFAMNFGVFG